jgi:hypothetical protein
MQRKVYSNLLKKHGKSSLGFSCPIGWKKQNQKIKLKMTRDQYNKNTQVDIKKE